MPHNCTQCGKPIEKKPHESVNRYNGKKYCSTICAKAWMKKNKIGWFAADAQTIKRPKVARDFLLPDEIGEL